MIANLYVQYLLPNFTSEAELQISDFIMPFSKEIKILWKMYTQTHNTTENEN